MQQSLPPHTPQKKEYQSGSLFSVGLYYTPNVGCLAEIHPDVSLRVNTSTCAELWSKT